MGITKIKGLLAVAMAGVLLVGCTKDDTNEDNDKGAEVVKPTTDAGNVAPTPAEVVRQKPEIRDGQINYILPDGAGEMLDGVFYFDFDQAIVKRTGHAELDKHADALKNNRGYSVRLEGHADERGTREYNLALGERRAMAVRAYLVNQGVSSRQLETISYGEEKPAVRGNTERDRAQNRRVVFKYSK